MQRTDAHQHFWQPARGDYAWLRPDDAAVAPLVRDFLPDALAPLLRVHAVTRTVLVQAAESVAETEYLLALANAHDFIAGVVGWVDLAHADAASTLARLGADPRLKGVRPMLQDLPAADWIVQAPRPDAIRALQDLGLRLDALVKPRQLAPLLRFAQAWPELPIVIDHAAKPPLHAAWNDAPMQAWRRDMAALAALPQVACKLSGLLTEMRPADAASRPRATEHLRPVLDALLGWFGPERLMWGSDWPVLTLASDYDDWVAITDALLAPLSGGERAHVLHGSAQRFYGLA
ncbi:MAG: amidohydrolase family protein [Betaproteobacteria bacterium]